MNLTVSELKDILNGLDYLIMNIQDVVTEGKIGEIRQLKEKLEKELSWRLYN